ncbi:MAG: HNH endonuclease [Gammaproteobacteria bacterium]|nr:HNH endonuclease [Gammaproteobacteria bacterium]
MDPITSIDSANEFSHLSKQELEQELTQHTANLNAATCKQILLIAEFDRRRGWAYEGVRSCAHWLNFRCGIALGAAREKIRVGHALSRLPKTHHAFASGALSYSKARAITRVATEHNEDTLLNIARYGTASQVETTVRLYRRQCEDPASAFFDPHSPNAETRCAARRHDTRRLQSYWDDDGCLVITARLPAEEGAVVLKAIEAATQVQETEQQSSDDVSAETSSLEYDDPGREKRRRRADALVSMASAWLQGHTTDAHIADRYQVVVHVDQELLSKTVVSSTAGKPDCYIEHETGLPVETVRRLSCDCKLVASLDKGGEPLSIGRRSRSIPTGIRRALHVRDGGVCQFPGCGCSKHLQAHHVVHWANGGETSLDNLVELCHYHHKLVHEGGYSLNRRDGKWQFFNADGLLVTHQPIVLKAIQPNTTDADDSWQWHGDSMDHSVVLGSMRHKNQRHCVDPKLIIARNRYN